MLTAAQAADILGIKPRTVYQLAQAGILACHRLGVNGGAVRFAAEDVEAYRASCRSTGTSATSAGATASAVSLRDAGTDLLSYFRAAGVKPKLTNTTGASRRGSAAMWHNRPNRKAQPVGDDLIGGKWRWVG